MIKNKIEKHMADFDELDYIFKMKAPFK